MKVFCCGLLFILALGCVSDGGNNLAAEISNLEQEVAKSPSIESMKNLYSLYETALAKAKKDTSKASLLWKSAETARGLKNFPAAENHYKEIYTDFNSTEWAPKALFLHAFMLDEDMDALDKARAMYQQYLQRYPDSDFADDAQFLLDNLGKTDEEILKILTEKNQASQE